MTTSNRRPASPLRWFAGSLAAVLIACASSALWARSASSAVVAYKTPTCGCCSVWVGHLRANGFEVEVHDVPDTPALRRREGIPARLGSCHTAKVVGYVIEGHGPAAEIRRPLRERPRLAGLAVPGMPIGSPGMAMGGRQDAYDVLAFNGAGDTTVFARYPKEKSR